MLVTLFITKATYVDIDSKCHMHKGSEKQLLRVPFMVITTIRVGHTHTLHREKKPGGWGVPGLTIYTVSIMNTYRYSILLLANAFFAIREI